MKRFKCGVTHHMACECREAWFSFLEANLDKMIKVALAAKDEYGVSVINDFRADTLHKAFRKGKKGKVVQKHLKSAIKASKKK